jgi:hypothetical protein
MAISKKIKVITLLTISMVSLVAAVGLYMYFKPHRDVQAEEAYATLTSIELTDAFSHDAVSANNRFLSSDGNSKVLVVTGTVANITTNQDGEPVVLIKEAGSPVGVMATLLQNQTAEAGKLRVGESIAIKGAITSGNTYDDLLDLYEHALLIQAAIVRIK